MKHTNKLAAFLLTAAMTLTPVLAPVYAEDRSGREPHGETAEATTLPPTTDPSEVSTYENFFIRKPQKQFYKIGDALDMSGAYASANGEQIPISDKRFSVDASAFDNTKPGVYTIYVTFRDGGYTHTDDFLVMVLHADGTAPEGYPTPTGEDNPYHPTDGVAMTTAPFAVIPATDGVTFDRLGDVDANGETDIMDVIRINKCLLGVSELTGQARLAADMNGNGKIDPEDAMAALKKTLGMVWQNAAEPVTEDPTDPDTEPTTMYLDPTDHCKELPSEEYEETTMLPSGAWDTQPAQISEHFYGADVWKGAASDGEDSPWISVETFPSGSSIGIYGYEFYKTNNLIIINLTEPSGSYELTVDDIVVDTDGNYVVKITRKIPQIANGNPVRWHLLVNTDKGCTSEKQVKLEFTDLHI